MESDRIAELLFPNIDKTPEYYEEKYPERDLPEGAMVTRLGPSPTGFIHLGNLYGAFVDERLAHQSGGKFFLRIEDTDDKRYVEGAVDVIINSLDFFGIEFDEGATQEGDKGDYGPYTQSLRGDIYQCFAKKLVAEGKAYPCFLTEEEIAEIRERQELAKVTPGIYGEYASCRDWSYDQVVKALGERRPYVIRLRSDGYPPEAYINGSDDKAIKKIRVKDAIRGTLEMPANFLDTVILKTTGIPTYHFAHVVDDHLMRTTHVVRGAEWLPSLPIHIELFEKLGWKPPVYCHTAQLMKLDENGNKRKLSKRKDPELSLDYYRNEGYHAAALREYLLTILNSNFEEWRMKNEDAPIEDFKFTTKKMSNSGALFDINKLNDVAKDVMLKIPAKDIAEWLRSWSDQFAPEYADMFEDMDYLEKILDIGREDRKPRKDLVYARQIVDFISYFFDKHFKIEDQIPEEVPAEDVKKILDAYLAGYDHSDDQNGWFGKIREIATDLGYAARPKDYKKNPDDYKGHVGHVSTVIRIALMGRATSPDVWTIQQIMGEDMTRARIRKYIEENC
ncbi:MAG: glutamate--tRNA ligase family protein [Eubacteriales bacterium]|nr:glutamate--tRNA ligase family protein [Eubacteriales bacterium]